MKKHIINIEEGIHTGGNIIVCFVHLANGQMLVVDDGLIGLYDSCDDFWSGRDGSWDHVKMLELKENENDDNEF